MRTQKTATVRRTGNVARKERTKQIAQDQKKKGNNKSKNNKMKKLTTGGIMSKKKVKTSNKRLSKL